MMIASNEIVKKLSPRIFWDINIETLDLHNNKNEIIERAFVYGTDNDEIIIWSIYTYDEIKKSVLNSDNLNDATIIYLSKVFNIKEKIFKCYGKKLSHLNY